MDRIGACGASDVGSIPTEGTTKALKGVFFVSSEKANCFVFVRNRKGSPLFLKSVALKKWETHTVRVAKDSC